MRIIELIAGVAIIGAVACSSTEESEQAAAPEVVRVELDQWSQKMSDESAVILDVRTPAEFSRGHIANAVNLDFQREDFAAELAKLDKNSTYLMHCASGGRSARVLEMMQEAGFNSVYELAGGINAWQNGGNPVVQD